MRFRLAVIAGSALLMVMPLFASGTNAVRLDVTVKVVPNCRIETTDLAFGVYDPIVENATRELDGTANVRVLCTRNARAAILIDSGSAGNRSLSSGGERLQYGIFSDEARRTHWTGESPLFFEFSTASTPRDLKVYGRIPPGQVVPAGWYTDTVTAIVDF